MGQEFRCLFSVESGRRQADPSLNSPDCGKPATGYRFHRGDDGRMTRLALYCREHSYGNCRPLAPEIELRAHTEGWPTMEWPPPPPEDPVEVLRELGEAGLAAVTDRQPELKRALARYLKWRDQQKSPPCPSTP